MVQAMSEDNNNIKGRIDQEFSASSQHSSPGSSAEFFQKKQDGGSFQEEDKKESLPLEESSPSISPEEVIEVQAYKERFKEKEDAYLRLLADMDNLKKRFERDKREAIKFAQENFSQDLVPFFDSFNQALSEGTTASDTESFKQGMSLVYKSLLEILAKNGISEIAPQKGQKFDPTHHQAIQTVVSEEVEDNAIFTVFVKGYALHGRVLRPAMVSVATRAAE